MPVIADASENNAFNKIQDILLGSDAFAKPAGSSKLFPDFGFTVMLGERKADIFFEFKQNDKAQMGSGSRDWIFDGSTFKLPIRAQDDLEKVDLIDIINNTPAAISKAKLILKDLQTYGVSSSSNKIITNISSGSFGIFKPEDGERAGAFTKTISL